MITKNLLRNISLVSSDSDGCPWDWRVWITLRGCSLLWWLGKKRYLITLELVADLWVIDGVSLLQFSYLNPVKSSLSLPWLEGGVWALRYFQNSDFKYSQCFSAAVAGIESSLPNAFQALSFLYLIVKFVHALSYTTIQKSLTQPSISGVIFGNVVVNQVWVYMCSSLKTCMSRRN